MSFSFRKGVHVSPKKYLTDSKGIIGFDTPPTVYIPTSQHIGKPAEVIVTAGQTVKEGELIAKAVGDFSANIYSSVSGTVKGIVKKNNALGVLIDHIEIENDFKDERVYLSPLDEINAETVKARIKEAGIVGMGGAAFPTAIKLNPPKGTEIDVLVINGAECEPYITCDHRVMLEKTDEFLEGARLLKLASGAKQLYIGIEENKIDAIKEIGKRENVCLVGVKGVKVLQKQFEDENTVKVFCLKEKYPQGAEKQLIFACTGRVVPDGGLPSAVGVCVDNVHTAFSVYKAVKENLPLYERVMTISGGAVKEPCNAVVKNGTLYSFLAEKCIAENPAMVISGGPMMGFAVHTLDVATTKSTGSVLFMTEKEVDFDKPTACIGCGKCVSVCPMRLEPVYIDAYSLNKDFVNAKKYGALSCIECGCCSYICPGNRPLVQSIRVAKKVIREKKI